MSVRVITDSLSDVPSDVAKELNIAIIPASLILGNEIYRDRIDLATDQFYERLATSNIFPTTAVPPLNEFTDVYDRLAQEADELLVITAAKAIRNGASLDEAINLTRHNMSRVEIRFAFDTLEYLKRGGRIGKVQAFLGSMLKIHPITTIKDGEAFPVARERSRAGAIGHLCQ